jgi:anti-anti-sigma factor
MEISRNVQDGIVELIVEGRLDSYWSDHLDKAMAEIVREGHDRFRLDLSRTAFLSSAGVGVLMKHHRQLTRINGWLSISQASDAVRTVLDLTRLTPVLFKPVQAAAAVAAPGRHIETPTAKLEVFDLAPSASYSCRVIGAASSLARPGTEQGVDVACPDSVMMVGIGGIGSTFEDCRDRFGDLLAAGGAVVYQPADGTNVPDYLVSSRNGAAAGDRQAIPKARIVYGMACDGQPASLVRFEPLAGAGAVSLAALAESCLEQGGHDAAGFVIVAEVAGLVGAALRQSPYAAAPGDGGFFAHPNVRERLTFTAQRAFGGHVALIAGLVARPGVAPDESQLRPIATGSPLIGHFHAAAFPFRPFRKGRIELSDAVAALFESERVLGVLHLLHDDRAGGGAGITELVRGACWMAPIRAWS